MPETAIQDPVRQSFFRNGDAAAVLAARSAEVDSLVQRAFESALAPAFAQGMAVLAVGGFGRRELFPHSDVDLLLLVEQEPRTPAARDAVAAFLRSLWDQGLRLGHSVHTPAECCQVDDRNVELSISLLDQRLLVGDPELYGKLIESLPKFFHARRADLTEHLIRLTRVRHARYSNTIYHMEPNVKEAPGGLRDLQLVRWLSQLRSAQPYQMPSPEAEPELEKPRAFLATLRTFLHYSAGRDSNLLSFDAQEEISEQPFFHHGDAAAWMRDYFFGARSIYRSATRWMETAEGQRSVLLSQFRDWRSRVSNSEFTVSRDRVLLKTPAMLATDPEVALRLFAFVARHGFRLAVDTERRICEHRAAFAAYVASARSLWPRLQEILSLPHASLALGAMHETGVLGILLPEWAAVECLVVRDFYHRFTVDEHTLEAIRGLEDLPASQDPLRRQFAGLLDEVGSRASLLAALLFHDLGKAARSGRHVEASVRLAEEALLRLGAPLETRDAVRFLIERHLDFSNILNTRDPDEPATAKFLAERVGTEERLKDLVLVTYADINAVNPRAMTPWRLEQLWRLYLIAHGELTRELDSGRIQAPPDVSPEMAAFLSGFPARYLRVHTPEELQEHLALYQHARQHGAVVDIRRRHGNYVLTVAAHDKPYLLASLAGALAGFGMNILKADVFGNRKGMVLDTFVFEDPKRTLDLNPTEVDRLRLTLERIISGRMDVRQLLLNRPRPAAPTRRSRIRPSVTFDNGASESSTLIEVVAEDRPGLLYDLARTLSDGGCNIELVLIDTEAHKALDVFYVTTAGGKLAPDKQADLREKLLRACRG